MKQIQPVSIWFNGQIIQATLFSMTSVSDNLSTQCIFYYQLSSSTTEQLANGNITMTGFDYEAYSTSPDSNEYAYQWGATQLNLTLI
jgi:ABC-type transporter Mla maintaining outer membrane lipid asymmetry ATPase subunit MlaF